MPSSLHEPKSVVELVVNGDHVNASAATLADLLDELGYRDAKVATAVNGAFVATSDRAQLALSPEDRVEIVAPRQGG